MDSETPQFEPFTPAVHFQFHWMDSKVFVDLREADDKTPFNSIEWIPRALTELGFTVLYNNLSIPLNGFLLQRMFSLVCYESPFNSIEWIPTLSWRRWKEGKSFTSFNSIEWIPVVQLFFRLPDLFRLSGSFNSIEWIHTLAYLYRPNP